MGKVVFTIKKPKGNDARTTGHIERHKIPNNADPERTHLNRELIRFPEGITNRTQAIQHRIKSANIARKITPNQIRALQVIISGSHEDMKRIKSEGKLDEWCKDSLEWMQQTFGKENVVSAVLHLDEKTPHIHATLVPIVSGERRKAKSPKENDPARKKYKKKKPGNRLCADDVMAKSKLEFYQDSYAEKMKVYGLERGIRGSEARHISNLEYYKELLIKNEELKENINELQEKEQAARMQYEQADVIRQIKESELRQTEEVIQKVKKELKTEKLKNTAADVGSTIIEGIGSVIGTSKVKKLQQEIEVLKQDKQELNQEVTTLKQSIQIQQKEHESILSKLKQELKKIYDLFPYIKELLRIENLCKHLGFSDHLTQKILSLKPVEFKGKLYSQEYKQRFETERSIAEIKQHPTEKGRLWLTIDGVSDVSWFRMKYKEFQQSIGINIRQSTKSKARGL